MNLYYYNIIQNDCRPETISCGFTAVKVCIAFRMGMRVKAQ